MTWITDPQIWVALVTLTALEIVLGIDNIIFISILAGKLPGRQRERARRIGLALAMVTRIALLFSLTWMMRLTKPWFYVFGEAISGRDVILIIGGLFLIAKSTLEIHDKLEGEEGQAAARIPASFAGIIIQIALLDIVFSLDSVITAIGMVNIFGVMVAAIVIATIFMILFARTVGDFVDRHPTVKVLALSFLVLIGVVLVGDGLDMHVPKGYIYFAMAFSVCVEMLNLKIRRRRVSPVRLRRPYSKHGRTTRKRK
ncbi:MAG: TerC family protein [Gammaproteobacteria bacterium]|nr:TerC family protein [Gammaproteobacteria bacterium]